MMSKRIVQLLKALKPFLDGFEYDPGQSDLDNEQPIHIRVTLGDWRRARFLVTATNDQLAERDR